MPGLSPDAPIEERLNRLNLVHPDDEEIYAMTPERLTDLFSHTTGHINEAKLIKSMIWQDYERLQSGELVPIYSNIRGYWYERLKPVLGRARAYAGEPDSGLRKQYNIMIRAFRQMVLGYQLFRYADFGFKDDRAPLRHIGEVLPNYILCAEKTGHFPFLQDMAEQYGITIISFHGQPSALSTEYLIADLVKAGVDLAGPLPVFTIVDFDPAGLSIAENFVEQLEQFGYQGPITPISLVHPKFMSKEQIAANRYPLHVSGSQRKKYLRWLDATAGGLEPYGYGKTYGLEADAMTYPQFEAVFVTELHNHLPDGNADAVRRLALTGQLIDTLITLHTQRVLG